MNMTFVKQVALLRHLEAEREAIHRKNGDATSADKERLVAISKKIFELQ